MVVPFVGVCTALVTPFTRRKRIDFENYGKLIDYQIKVGVSAILVAGTTGEGATLSEREKSELFSFAVNRANGKIKVIASVGANDTSVALRLAESAKDSGVDCLLAVTPYYNKTSELGLVRYYETLSRVGLPFIVYHVPSRTGMRITPKTFFRLAEIENVVAVKEASGNLAETMEWALPLRDKLALYSGSDELFLPMLSIGASGIISVVSNLLPAQCVKLYSDYRQGNFDECLNAQSRLSRLVDLLFEQVNPIPVKYAMSLTGFCENVLREPLVGLDESVKKKIRFELKRWASV